MNIDKIISILRQLKEEGEIANSLGNGKIAGTVEAGDTPPVRKKNKYIYRTGFCRNWLEKRKPPL